jgi:L-iditol 2-dehydrogenase
LRDLKPLTLDANEMRYRTAPQLHSTSRTRPKPGPGEVLVRIGSVGVCGSDVHYFEHGRIGRFVVERPLVLGHEAGGDVVAVGPGVTVLAPGQRVSVEPGVPCRSCSQCLAGRYNLCPYVRFFATPPYDGAFCEYVVMPVAFVHAVPDSVSEDAAALLEPLSVGIWASRRGNVTAGSRVLVVGAGPIGLVCMQAARAFGATQVWVSDVNPHRLALAGRLGATACDVSQQGIGDYGIEPDVLLECSGNARSTADAIRTVARAGHVVLVGMGSDELPIPLAHVQDHELVLTGAFRYANTWPTAIALVDSGRVDVDSLVTGHYGLDDVENALTAARRDPTVVKAVVRPGR